MRYLFFCWLTAIFTVRSVYAQTHSGDSLLASVKGFREDTAGISLLLKEGRRTEQSEPQKSRYFYNKALLLSRSLDASYSEVSSALFLIRFYLNINQYDSALLLSKQILPLSKAGKYDDKTGPILNNIGSAYMYLNKPELAVDYFQEAVPYMSKDIGNLAIITNNLSYLSFTMMHYDKAIEYGKKAVEVSLKGTDMGRIAGAYGNLGAIYHYIKQRENAGECFDKQLFYSLKTDNANYRAAAFRDKGNYDREAGDLKNALRYADSAVYYSAQISNMYQLAANWLLQGQVHYDMKRYGIAKKYLYKAREAAEKTGEWFIMKDVYKSISDVEERMGNTSEAYKFLKKYSGLVDSSYNKGAEEKIGKMEAAYQSEIKEQQIKQLKSDKEIQTLTIRQKNTLNYLLAALLIILLILALFAYFAFRQKQLLQYKIIHELQIEKKLAATEAILKGQEDERSRLAKDLHDGLGGMLSGVKYSFQRDKNNLIMDSSAVESFQRSIDMLDTSIHELRRVAHNLMPESLVKYGLSAAINDYCTSINNSGAIRILYQPFNADSLKLDQSRSIILYRIVQELINNTLKHAAASEMIVQLSLENEQLAITVEDNGKGFDTLITKKAHGMGWSNIYSRIDYLKGSLDVNSAPGKGTYVHIIINLKG